MSGTEPICASGQTGPIHELATSREPVAELRTYHRNPRRGDVDSIARSLAVQGQYKPVVVNRGTHTGRRNEVLAGNHTLMAARSLDWSHITVCWVDVDDDQAARIVAADNRTADLGSYDDAALADLLGDLESLDGTGYTDADLAALLAGNEHADSAEDEAARPVPEPPASAALWDVPPGEPFYSGDGLTIYAGDCVDVLKTLPDNSVDAVVTDPPYGLEFMGKEWDAPWKSAGRVMYDPAKAGGFQDGNGGNPYSRSRIEYGRGPDGTSAAFGAWCDLWVAECLRVLKPGGHLLAFGASRVWHRLATSIEDAGFELRDSIAWLYATGFPKSLDVSKAIDKGAGHWRGRAGARTSQSGSLSGPHYVRTDKGDPVTAAAATWHGWGTALKPAFEPIVVARKPLAGGVVDNVLAHHTGALNIDGCRVEHDAESAARSVHSRHIANVYGKYGASTYEAHDAGRWPTNVVLAHANECGDECAPGCSVAELDAQSGESRSVSRVGTRTGRGPGSEVLLRGQGEQSNVHMGHDDEGGASRFFPTFRYQAKAPSSERPEVDGVLHPTVKPVDLMRWLVRLVTPPGGVVLDPFMGSGTTAQAARDEGFRCVGIERDAAYARLICDRLGSPERTEGAHG